MSAPAHPTIAVRPFLPADASLLAEIFRASIEELTADDYSRSPARGLGGGGRRRRGVRRAAGQAVDAAGTIDGSPVGFASLKAPAASTCSMSIRRWPGRASRTMLIDALEKLAAARGAGKLTADVSDSARISSSSAASSRRRATPSRSAANGSPTPRWKRSLPRRRRRHDQARHAVPKHWLYYIVLKYGVIAAAVLIALYTIYRLI